MAEKEQLTAILQLSLHDSVQESNGFVDRLLALEAINEQEDKQQVGLFGVDPLDLAADVATDHPAPMEELDEACAIASVMSHSDHLGGVVTDEP